MKIKKGTLVLLLKILGHLPSDYRLALAKERPSLRGGLFKVKCIDGTERTVEKALPLIQVDEQIKDVNEAIRKYTSPLLEVLIEKLCESLGREEEES